MTGDSVADLAWYAAVRFFWLAIGVSVIVGLAAIGLYLADRSPLSLDGKPQRRNRGRR